MQDPKRITAAVLVIGDEILSGRTQDTNLAAIARFLGPFGIDVAEARFVPDVQAEIVAAVNALRSRYDYVFTTGGIGPTHDDITADAIGAAFGRLVDHHPEALALLAARYAPGDFNERRKRMARVPEGASLVKNSVSAAPGFQIENVFVMAGVPKIMQAMLEDIAPRLARGVPVISSTLTVPLPEGAIAEDLAGIQRRYPEVTIGSYPFFSERSPGGEPAQRRIGTSLVVRGRDSAKVEAAMAEVRQLALNQGVAPESLKMS